MSAAGPITRSSLQETPFGLIFQAKLAKGGAIYHWRSDLFPRLVKQTYRGSRQAPTRVTWVVDDRRCNDLDEALRFLNARPVPADLFEAAAP